MEKSTTFYCPNCGTAVFTVEPVSFFKTPSKTILDEPLSSVGWPNGCLYAFKYNYENLFPELKTFGDLCTQTEHELLHRPNIGPMTVKEIKKTLKFLGLHLAEEQ